MGTTAETPVKCGNKSYPVTINPKALIITGKITPCSLRKAIRQEISRIWSYKYQSATVLFEKCNFIGHIRKIASENARQRQQQAAEPKARGHFQQPGIGMAWQTDPHFGVTTR